MSAGGWIMAATVAVALGALAFLVFAAVRSIRDHRSSDRGVMREFGLGIVLPGDLGGPGRRAVADLHRRAARARGVCRARRLRGRVRPTTLENWQSEFLQLFAFVALSALYIHKGSAESKDSDENVEASLRRIEERLGTLPATAPQAAGERWRLPETPLEVMDEQDRRTVRPPVRSGTP
jgi:hypothetical protein